MNHLRLLAVVGIFALAVPAMAMPGTCSSADGKIKFVNTTPPGGCGIVSTFHPTCGTPAPSAFWVYDGKKINDMNAFSFEGDAMTVGQQSEGRVGNTEFDVRNVTGEILLPAGVKETVTAFVLCETYSSNIHPE